MRITSISPEFIYQKVNGTFNMVEHSSFFGSKMLEIDDSISIKNDNIIYYEQSNGEQLDANVESALPQIVYNAVDDKRNNQILKLDDAQTDEQKQGNARWILDIQIQSVLRDYIFATMKKWRTFEGVKNNMTISNSVDSAIKEYIDKNVLNRYKFSKIEFFLQSVDLISVGGLKYNNQYDPTIESSTTLYTKFSTETDANDLDIRLKFYQELPANLNAFKYYFNLYFEKL
jgi:hypothetical protein